MNWTRGLLTAMKDPDLMVISNKEIVVIKDKFPKAKHHFLVLPKENISSIFHLTRHHLKLLNEMHLLAVNAIESVGRDLDEFKIGYHAIPSMQQLHLHVISTDFNSPCLKTKKHWNSFNTAYFVPHEDLVDQLNKNGKIEKLAESVGKELLATPLKCNKCGQQPKTIPDLKKHIGSHVD